MEVGGEIRRGKTKRDTAIMLALSLAAIALGIAFVLLPVTAEAYSFGYYLIRVLGVFALVIGSGCTVNYWQKLRCELYPL